VRVHTHSCIACIISTFTTTADTWRKIAIAFQRFHSVRLKACTGLIAKGCRRGGSKTAKIQGLKSGNTDSCWPVILNL
jgi:hypothetical protein